MQLFLLTAVVMAAFAANSVLTRMAVGEGVSDALSFALFRVCAGAVVLAALLVWRKAAWPGLDGQGRGRLAGVAGLSAYLIGFSMAYKGLDAGAGALVLFGVVQITMFAGAVMLAEAVPPLRWAGAGLAFAGLVLLLWPGESGIVLGPALMMAVAGLGWGTYSLAGRGAGDPMATTAANFLLAVPVVAAAWLVVGEMSVSPAGAGLAVLSGAVTSGLGYALWYQILPQLGAGRAAVAQLSVPVLAAAGGAVMMDEGVGLRFALAAVLVLGGVALAVQSGLTKR